VGSVIQAFREALPFARLYVFDNCSTDRSVEIARNAGALVRRVDILGKGQVIRRMFADIDAGVFLVVDADDTYDASSSQHMVRMVLDGYDLVNAARNPLDRRAFPPGHVLGNRVLSALVFAIFGKRMNDMLSGYKAFSRRFVKSFPIMSNGFEIETEMTVHALELAMPVAEICTPYRSRPSGSVSKLSTRRDGLRILRTIFSLVRQERPLAFFLMMAFILVTASLSLAVPLLLTYIKVHQVPRLPTAVLATGIMVLAFLSATAGVILDTVTRGRREAKMIAYLASSRFGSNQNRHASGQAHDLGDLPGLASADGVNQLGGQHPDTENAERDTVTVDQGPPRLPRAHGSDPS
jgi:hypothetical protein